MSAKPSRQTAIAPSAFRLRILTYNIRHGQGSDGRLDLDRLARIIRDLNPDLVALQEVDRRTRRAGGVDQAIEIGRLTGMQALFGRAMDFEGGQYGEVILSRHPLVTSAIHPLPCQADSESRCALEARIRLPDNIELRFIGTHLDHLTDEAGRILQAGAIAGLFSRDSRAPMILAGDMNAQPGSAPIRILAETWLDTGADRPLLTFPADNPVEKIDYIFVKPAACWRILGIRTIEEKVASDHLPLLATLEIRPPFA